MTDSQPPITPRQRRAERNRRLILQAAMELLVREGPEKLSLREVARRSDYSPAALYEYFPSRSDLLAALWLEVDQLLQDALAAIPPGLQPSDRLVALGMNTIRFARQNPQLYRLYFGNPDVQNVEELVTHSIVYRLLVEVLQAGIHSDDFKTQNGFGIDEMVTTCWGLLHGMASLQVHLSNESAADLDLLNLKALETLVIGLQALRG